MSHENGVQTTGPDLIMIHDADEDVAGASVWWSLRDDCPRQALVDALAAVGLKHVAPPALSAEVAIRRAVATLRGKRRLVRPLTKGSWAIVEEQLNEKADALKHWTGPTFSLDKIGRPVVKNATVEEADQVKKAYEYHFDALSTEDVSGWLIEQTERLGAQGLRRGGGIYWLPPKSMPEWRKIVSAVGVAAPTHSIYKMPTVKMTRDGARAILESLQADLADQVATITADMSGGSYGSRGLQNRIDTTKALLAKVTSYEGLLSTNLDAARSSLEALEVELVAARARAEAEEDEERKRKAAP